MTVTREEVLELLLDIDQAQDQAIPWGEYQVFPPLLRKIATVLSKVATEKSGSSMEEHLDTLDELITDLELVGDPDEILGLAADMRRELVKAQDTLP